jgi:hypothetical protein
MLRTITRFLCSLRFTIFLIAALGMIFLLGLWIPQKGVIEYEEYLQWKRNLPILVAAVERLGLMEIYRAPLTLTLWVLFFINLSLVMWQRMPVVRRRLALPDPLPDPQGGTFPITACLELSGSYGLEQIFQLLRRAGYVCYGTAERFYGIRNRRSPAASLLFHLSFFLLLLGGLTGVYTRFVGIVDLAEGETFNGELERYTGKPALPRIGSAPKLQVTIRKVTPLIEAQTPTGLRVNLEDGRARMHTLDINSPFKEGTVSMVVKDLGLAPLFILRDGRGRELDGAFVKLNILRGKEDGFRMGGREFRVRFFPDHQMVNGEDTTRTEEFRNPVLAVLTIDGSKRTINRIPYAAGARIPLGETDLVLARQSFWVRFTVVSEHGVLLVYAGFLLACTGLLWRLGFYRREVAGALVPGEGGALLHLAFRSEFYRALGEEEFSALQQQLKVSGDGGANGERG